MEYHKQPEIEVIKEKSIKKPEKQVTQEHEQSTNEERLQRLLEAKKRKKR